MYSILNGIVVLCMFDVFSVRTDLNAVHVERTEFFSNCVFNVQIFVKPKMYNLDIVEYLFIRSDSSHLLSVVLLFTLFIRHQIAFIDCKEQLMVNWSFKQIWKNHKKFASNSHSMIRSCTNANEKPNMYITELSPWNYTTKRGLFYYFYFIEIQMFTSAT